jgi:hypothetical protein
MLFPPWVWKRIAEKTLTAVFVAAASTAAATVIKNKINKWMNKEPPLYRRNPPPRIDRTTGEIKYYKERRDK